MNFDDFYPEERKFSRLEAMIYYMEHPDESQRAYAARWKWGLSSVNRFINGTLNSENGTPTETLNFLFFKILKNTNGTLFGTPIIYNNIYKEIEGNLHSLQIAVQKELPYVSKLPQQLTQKQCENLLKDYTKQQIWDCLLDMDNWTPLVKTKKSVNQTLRQWLNKNGVRKKGQIVV